LGTGVSSLQPLRVELRRPEGARAAFEAHFGCPILFGAGEDASVFHVGDVERPFGTHDADLLAVLAPHLDGELKEQQAARGVSSRVKQILKRLLAGGRHEVRDVARELRVASRTLQRRIAEEGHTWQQLLEEARRALSRHYLAEAKLELNEAAFLVGYGDASSVFRAFRQWEGTSPGRWRLDRGMAVSPTDAGRSATG
jgi:AraC-like DNA-binding protein